MIQANLCIMKRSLTYVVVLLAVASCGGNNNSVMRAGGGGDAGATPMLRLCPGKTVADNCFVLTPAESGLPESGANAMVDQYALRPTTAPLRHQLLLFLNGSGGSPQAAVAAGATNWYTTARDAGLHVLGVSYRSDEAIGNLCTGATRDACFVPSRDTVLLGVYQSGAASSLATIRSDEGVYARMAAALVMLTAADPLGGWDAFIDLAQLKTAENSVRWDRVLVSGHSQGGGHAALLGRRHALARVLMLSSPCDGAGTNPASWLANDGTWATDPKTRFVGLGAPGDNTCPSYATAWTSLGMPASVGRTDASVCAGQSAHGATLFCASNALAWQLMLQ
jgi:hypothetical protein